MASEKRIFWLEEFDGEARGGLFYRAFDLVNFIKKVERKPGRKIVGIVIDNTANIELIYEGDNGSKQGK